jgi:hypothetical protein
MHFLQQRGAIAECPQTGEFKKFASRQNLKYVRFVQVLRAEGPAVCPT